MEGASWLGSGLARDLELLRGAEIAPDPILAVAWGEVPTKARERASRFAAATVERCWSEDDRLRWFGPITLPTDVPWDALFLAYTNGLALDGVLQPGGGHRVERLERRVARFVDAHGIMPIVRVFCTYRAYEHGLALTTYGESMTEADFLSGRLHLPGFSHSCRGDLLYGIAHGWLELTVLSGVPHVRMTRVGRDLWERIKAAVDGTGAIQDRERFLQRLQWIRDGANYAALGERLAPDQGAVRREFLIFGGIQAGMRVMDAGCGYGEGVVTPGGVADVVGPRGEVIALDPQQYLLAQLTKTARDRGLSHVRTERGVAERTGFSPASLDAITTQTALHFFDVPAFAREAFRILKPGGILAASFPTPGFGKDSPFFLAVQQAIGVFVPCDAKVTALPLCAIDGVRDVLGQQGFVDIESQAGATDMLCTDPDDLATFLLATVRYLQRGLAGLPWGEQQERTQGMRLAIRDVVLRFPPDQRRIKTPYGFVRARKPGEAERLATVSADLTVELASGTIAWRNQRLAATPTAGRVLGHLALADGPISAMRLSGMAGGVSVQSVYNAIRELRRALPEGIEIRMRVKAGYVLVVRGPGGVRRNRPIY